jgi:arylformamidase
MGTEFYDISRSLSARIATWPGDTAFSLHPTFAQDQGHSVNVGRLQMSIHTGTHIDAPYHFDAAGKTTDQLNLAAFWGPAQVVTVEKETGALQVEDLAAVDLGLAPRLLLHTSASQLADGIFPAEIVYPSLALVEALATAGIRLLGTDACSMDELSDQQLAGHTALNRHGISILEGLNLSGVPDGLYELCALPLKIVGADGSPVRAVLRR